MREESDKRARKREVRRVEEGGGGAERVGKRHEGRRGNEVGRGTKKREKRRTICA